MLFFAIFVSIHRCKMLMPKRDRVLIYEHLFREGVLVAKKDVFLPCHPEFDNVKNLHVMKACKSLKSRGLVKENYTWSHYYYSLTNDGIEFLREFLHLPSEIVPATLKRSTRPSEARPRPKVDEPRRAYQGGDREAYRQGGVDKKADAGAGMGQFDFRGGYGRGRGSGGAPPS